MTGWSEQFMTVLRHELRTLWRTRSIWMLAIGFLGLTLGTALLGGASGYVPLSLSLLTPLELVLPVLTVALGYRAILADRERGELRILRTYPIESETFIAGVYVGRLTGLLFIVVGSLLIAGVLVPIVRPSPAVLTQSGGLDSPLLYMRFVVLTGVFAAVLLAMMVLLSAIVRNARRGLILSVVLVITLAVGFDLAIILGLAGNLLAPESIPWYLAMGPVSAYRGLVLSYVVAPAVTTPVEPAAPLISIASLSVWFVFSLMTAAWLVWRPTSN